MIIGGASGALLAGGGRAGYSERYLAATAIIIPDAYRQALEQGNRKAIVYTASARVRNVANDAWLDVGEVSYFQVTKNPENALWQANVTVQKPQLWSPYITGGTYEDVLLPSNRRFQLFCGLVIDGTSYESQLFEGHVVAYQETLGASGGAINLRLEDNREIASRVDSIALSTAGATLYRAMLNQIIFKPVAEREYKSIDYQIADAEIVPTSTGPLTYPTSQEVIDGLNPGAQLSGITPGNHMLVNFSGSSSVDDTPIFSYGDDSIISLQRIGGSANFNTMRTYGLVDGNGTTGEASDSTDVAKRGKVYYVGGLIGSAYIDLAEANAIATAAIAQELRGKVSCEIVLNPILVPGMKITIGSDRFGVTSGSAVVRGVNHQYAVGRARTFLNGLVLE